MSGSKKGILLAILAAALYAVNAPFSKLLLTYMPPTLMAGFLYLGAGIGMGFVALARCAVRSGEREAKLEKRELPFVLLMILLDVAAPIFLLLGLMSTSAAGASLLNNFEIVATALVALLLFKEQIAPRLWAGIAFVTASCILLSVEDFSSLSFSYGSLFILLAAVCWGFENNCTRKISSKDPLQIVLLKGIFSGGASVVIGLLIGERIGVWWSIPAVLTVGLVAYGMSIFVYVHAQRLLGAARTGAYYAVAPFLGTTISFIFYPTVPSIFYFVALPLMAIGAFLAAADGPLFRKRHRKH